MSSRNFEHPLQRHPAVAPVLQLVTAAPDATFGAGALHASIVQLRATMALEAWAVDRFGLRDRPGYAKRFAGRLQDRLPNAEGLATLPARLAEVHRADEHDPALTETARLACTEGTHAARAFMATCARPSLAARRAAERGLWPGVTPTFIGRLEDPYRPSVLLADALAADERWTDARCIARQLPKRLRLGAEKAIVRRQVAAGVHPGPLSVPLHDEYLLHQARLAASRSNFSASSAFIREISDGRRRAVAHHDLHEQCGRLEPIWLGPGGMARAGDDVVDGGVALLMHADRATQSAQPRVAWQRLTAAATAPRQGHFWLDGVRPDLRIAQHLLFVALKYGQTGRWPWGRRRQVALLDRLDAVRPVVDRLGTRQVEEALQGDVVRAKWLQDRLRQALFVRAIERVDTVDIGRYLHRAPEAEAFLRGLMGDLAFGEQLTRDPTDPIRAFYDDGLARSPRAARRRSGLLQAARRTLTAAIHQGPTDAANIRLHTMAWLGGDRARRTLNHRMARTAPEHPLFAPMIHALVRIDGRRGRRRTDIALTKPRDAHRTPDFAMLEAWADDRPLDVGETRNGRCFSFGGLRVSDPDLLARMVGLVGGAGVAVGLLVLLVWGQSRLRHAVGELVGKLYGPFSDSNEALTHHPSKSRHDRGARDHQKDDHDQSEFPSAQAKHAFSITDALRRSQLFPTATGARS